MAQKTAMIAMSGGVDSSVAAQLMIDAGYRCVGATMRLLDHAAPEQNHLCKVLQDIEDAKKVADRLGFPHYVYNFSKEFQEQVVDRFVSCYECGTTPNPCVTCNRFIKFGVLLDKGMDELGCDYVVTGHYARIAQDPDTGRWLLKKATHTAKDQSYFLYNLTQNQLAHTIFPLGDLTKEEVRAIAEKHGFVNAHKRDSQDVCFIPSGDYTEFLERYTGKKYPEGDFLDWNGTVVGHHHGAIGYTLGQRKGLGVAMGEPVYVTSKDMKKNTVTVGRNEDLFSRELLAEDWNWFLFPELTEPVRVLAKARSRMTEQPATVYPEADGKARVIFDEPQRAITPGQAVVLYQGDVVVGGGTIIDAM